MKLKKENKQEFKINNLLDSPIWKSIACVCGTTITQKYPLSECMHCKFQESEDSMPRKEFLSNGQKINEITIVRGSKYQDIIAFTWSSK